jgi:hypothetical protein
MKIFIITTHPVKGSKKSEFLGTLEQAKEWIAQASRRTNQLTFKVETRQ